MSTPSVSIVMLTYARTAMLAESIYSTLIQDYDGDVEIIVVNTCPLQTISCAGVRVVNAPQWASAPLGLVRDEALRLATHDVVCMWDDDDVYLASHVSSLVAKLRDGEPAARLQGMLTWDGVKMGERGGSTNAAHTALFRRAAYGTWPIAFDRNADSGCADNEFWQRAMNGGWFVGRHHHEPDGILSCILRMDPGRDRASDSERGLCTSQHVRDLWCARVYNGEEPKGAVEIVPAWSRNWQIVADEYKAST